MCGLCIRIDTQTVYIYLLSPTLPTLTFQNLPWPATDLKEVLVSPRFRDLRGRGTVQSLCADGHGAHQVSGLDTVELDGACL
jgi:hypothetical protein